MQSPFISKTTFYSSKAQMIRKENSVYIFFFFHLKWNRQTLRTQAHKKRKKRNDIINAPHTFDRRQTKYKTILIVTSLAELYSANVLNKLLSEQRG